MGVKTPLHPQDLPSFIEIQSLEKSSDGISDSVYFWEKDKILKIYESASPQNLRAEITLLKHLRNLCVPHIYGDVLRIGGKPALVFERLLGNSLKHTNTTHIRQIATFLKKMHTLTCAHKSQNTPLFEKEHLQRLILKTKDRLLLEYYHRIEIHLRNDGIIHGDLFLDNAVFDKDTLTGVFDFAEACEGDFLFDIAVVCVDWCFERTQLNQNKLQALIDAYDGTLNKAQLYPYIQYALLYYATTRTLANTEASVLRARLEGMFDEHV